MKRFLALFVAVSVMLVVGIAFAGTAKDNTGCGLGTMLWKESSSADGSTVSQSLQATTNGTFGNQTFGITSGTSDCKQPAKFVENKKLQEFVSSNLDTIAKEIAIGRGETLDAMAELMEISAPQRADFYAKLQTGFDKIFTSEKVEYAAVVDSIAAAYSQI
ncbi:MAG: DUF3015 domain-containing protein [Nitrospiraceae bacterium]|nr:DUF3015 domain-containing protein [Nitrospiraceae bacterium]